MKLQSLSEKEISRLSRIEIALEREIYKESFYEFYKAAFCQLHPGLEYDENWHAKYICDILQEETFRIVAKKPREKDLIINVPPRSSKSMIVTVIWPIWSWTINPTLKFLRCSYSDTIATNLARQSKDLIQTNWFQRLYGYKITLRPDLSGAGHYGNTASGFMYSFGMDGTVTGMGGDVIVCLKEDQKILTDNGEIEIGKIVNEKLQVKVASYNHEKNEIQYKPIIRYDKNLGKRLMKIKTENNKELICTEDHEVWTENRGYIQAKHLTLNDILKYYDCEYLNEINSIEYLEEIPDYVYNLQIADNHNYFVNGILTHNCDDPANPKESESEVERAKVIERWNNTVSNRLNQLELGGRVIVCQRLHISDLPGTLLDEKTGRPDTIKHICIPAEYDEKLVKPAELKQYYHNGKLFWPTRFSERVLSEEKRKGQLYFAGQFQQTPVPLEGNLFKRSWFEIIEPEFISRNEQESPIHFFLDTAYTDKQDENDPTGILAGFKKGSDIYIINYVEVFQNFTNLCKFAVQYATLNGYTGASGIYIESKANGMPIVERLREATSLNVIDIEIEGRMPDKMQKAVSISPIANSGKIKLVKGAWNDYFLSSLCAFPKAQHDEVVDCLYYAVNQMSPIGGFFADWI